MGNTSDNKNNRPAAQQPVNIGILAHVDAGKTTLSEAMLYRSGAIRSLGRVDNRDAFLDTYELERNRGITIFSKQARLRLGEKPVTLLDTPGHVDFSAEMERTLQVIDYAVLVISGADGVQGHTRTLWKLLKRYRVPTFLFVNKMDQQGTDRGKLLEELRRLLDDRCVDFSAGQDRETFLENIAVCGEEAMESYLGTGEIPQDEINRLICRRELFPCWFGSALKLEGVDEFLHGLEICMTAPEYGEQFGARVYKIGRDEQGNRLTYLKVTGGALKVKDLLSGGRGEDAWEEKVNQIRLYSGSRYETAGEAAAGTVCAVTGLGHTYPGEGLGAEEGSNLPVLEPVLSCSILLPRGCDPVQMVGKLRTLEEEEPELHIRWDEKRREIQAQLMGEVQMDVLKTMIRERFDVSVDFGEGSIVYKETIANTVEGVGHFEPLRHYAEVHLLLEPGEPGSGLQFASACSEDQLSRNWQRLILTHLEEKTHVGVLTGSELTDVRITLISGKAHLKHTEGGDFRQATYRAVRQGLMQAQNVLLEPYYEFRLEIPLENVGRAMTDLEKMHASFEQPETEGEMSVLSGSAPVSAMRNYQQEVTSYTKGRGRLSCLPGGYAPCRDAEEVIRSIGYDPEADVENTPDSVFCYHGAGTVIPWYEVKEHMHLADLTDSGADGGETESETVPRRRERAPFGTAEEEKELEEIFARTFGAPKRRLPGAEDRVRVYGAEEKDDSGYVPGKRRSSGTKENPEEYLLVDGYNVIFAWDELNEMAKTNIDGARGKLMDVLCNYQGFRKCNLILVFDAYRVEGHVEETVKYHNIYVVYTKEAETADQYIERTAHTIGRKYQVTVATSDGLEQIIIRGQGCRTMSARELKEETERISREIRAEYLDRFPNSGNYLFDYLPEELAEHLNDVRLGRKSLNGEEE